jgi:hypothetical protein
VRHGLDPRSVEGSPRASGFPARNPPRCPPGPPISRLKRSGPNERHGLPRVHAHRLLANRARLLARTAVMPCLEGASPWVTDAPPAAAIGESLR